MQSNGSEGEVKGQQETETRESLLFFRDIVEDDRTDDEEETSRETKEETILQHPSLSLSVEKSSVYNLSSH